MRCGIVVLAGVVTALAGLAGADPGPGWQRCWLRAFWEEGLPAGGAVVADADRAYVATNTGTLQGLDLATGRLAWKASAPAGFSGPPALAEGRLFVPAFDGCLYAYAAADGRTLWARQLAVVPRARPVVLGSLVLLAGRDGYLYAFSAADGTCLWAYRASAPLLTGPAVDRRLGRAYLLDARNRLHTLDAATGQPLGAPAELPGVWLADGRLSVTPEGLVRVQTLLGPEAVRDEGPSGLRLWQYDPVTAQVTAAPDDPPPSDPLAELARAVEATEPWAGSAVSALRGTHVPPGREVLPTGFGPSVPDSVRTVAGGDGQTVLVSRGAVVTAWRRVDRPGQPQANLPLPRLTAGEVARLHDGPISWDWVYPDRYDTPAMRGWPVELAAPLGSRPNPDTAAGDVAGRLPAAELARYVWRVPVPGELPDTPAVGELRGRLAQAVAAYIAEPRWRAYRLPGRGANEPDTPLHADPAEAVLALASAYPYLPAELRVSVREYLRAAVMEQDALFAAPLAGDAGAPRDGRGQTPPVSYPPLVRRAGLERLEAAWLWASWTGAELDLVTLWPRLVGLLDSAELAGAGEADCGNARCSGLIALARIARMVGDGQAASRAEQLAVAALRDRLAYELSHSRGGVLGVQGELGVGYVRWQHLSPTVGRMLADLAGPAATGPLTTQLDRLRPGWFLTRGPTVTDPAGTGVNLPHHAMAGFAAQAFLGTAPPERLALWADVPDGPADPTHIRKLAWTLWAHAGRPLK